MNIKIFRALFRSIIVILTLFVIGCDFISFEQPPTHGDTVIRGKVIDKDTQLPLDSVKFTLVYSTFMGMDQRSELSPNTDSTGTFRFETYCSEDYSYTLEFSRNDYTSEEGYWRAIEKGQDNYYLIEMVKDTIKAK